MQFKKGCGWKACYDEKRNLYTAETGGKQYLPNEKGAEAFVFNIHQI